MNSASGQELGERTKELDTVPISSLIQFQGIALNGLEVMSAVASLFRQYCTVRDKNDNMQRAISSENWVLGIEN
jgi:hypothetical protein